MTNFIFDGAGISIATSIDEKLNAQHTAQKLSQQLIKHSFLSRISLRFNIRFCSWLDKVKSWYEVDSASTLRWFECACPSVIEIINMLATIRTIGVNFLNIT